MSDNPMMFTYINETITMDEWELKIVFLFFSRICLHPKCCLETKGGRKNIYYDNKSKATAVVFNDVRVCLRVCVTGEIKKKKRKDSQPTSEMHLIIIIIMIMFFFWLFDDRFYQNSSWLMSVNVTIIIMMVRILNLVFLHAKKAKKTLNNSRLSNFKFIKSVVIIG